MRSISPLKTKLISYGAFLLVGTSLALSTPSHLWATDVDDAVSDGAADAAPQSFLAQLTELREARAALFRAPAPDAIGDDRRDIGEATAEICNLLMARNAAHPLRPLGNITGEERIAMLETCLETGVLYQGCYAQILRHYLRDGPLAGGDLGNNQLTCLALSLIASLHEQRDAANPLALGTALTAPGARCPLDRDGIQLLLQRVNQLQRAPLVWASLPVVSQGIAEHRRDLATTVHMTVGRQLTNLWGERYSTSLLTRPEILACLQDRCNLAPAQLTRAQRLAQQCQSWLDLATGTDVADSEEGLRTLLKQVSELERRHTIIQRFSTLEESARQVGALGTSRLLEEHSWLEQLPRKRIRTNIGVQEVENPDSSVVQLRNSIAQLITIITHSTIDGAAFTAEHVLAYLEARSRTLIGRHYTGIRRSVPDDVWAQAVMAGTPDEHGRQVGRVPTGGYVDFDAVAAAQRAWFSRPEVLAIPTSRLVEIFDESFPGGRALPEGHRHYVSPNFNDQGRPIDVMRAREALTGGFLAYELGLVAEPNPRRGETLRPQSNGSGKHWELYYWVKRALVELTSRPDDRNLRETVFHTLVAGCLHCIQGKHEVAVLMGRMLFPAGDPIAPSLDLTFSNRMDTALYDLRSAQFRRIIDFPGNAETGATDVNYRHRFATAVGVAGPLSGLCGYAYGYSSDSDGVFNLSVAECLERFFRGKRGEATAVGDDNRSIERRRAYQGYDLTNVAWHVFHFVNSVQGGARVNLAPDALNHLAPLISDAEIDEFRRWALQPENTSGALERLHISVVDPEDPLEAYVEGAVVQRDRYLETVAGALRQLPSEARADLARQLGLNGVVFPDEEAAGGLEVDGGGSGVGEGPQSEIYRHAVAALPLHDHVDLIEQNLRVFLARESRQMATTRQRALRTILGGTGNALSLQARADIASALYFVQRTATPERRLTRGTEIVINMRGVLRILGARGHVVQPTPASELFRAMVQRYAEQTSRPTRVGFDRLLDETVGQAVLGQTLTREQTQGIRQYALARVAPVADYVYTLAQRIEDAADRDETFVVTALQSLNDGTDVHAGAVLAHIGGHLTPFYLAFIQSEVMARLRGETASGRASQRRHDSGSSPSSDRAATSTSALAASATAVGGNRSAWGAGWSASAAPAPTSAAPAPATGGVSRYGRAAPATAAAAPAPAAASSNGSGLFSAGYLNPY